MNKEYFGLMYPDGVLMGIDRDSGGYPYRAEHPANVKYFGSKKEALEYNKCFKNSFKLVEIRFYIITGIDEN